MLPNTISADKVNIGHYGYYDVFHICSCGTVYSHSQGDCDEHRLHALPHSTYPIEYYRVWQMLKHNAEAIGKTLHPQVVRDLIASHCLRRGMYRNYKQAQDKVNPFAQDLIWHGIRRTL